MGGSHGNMKIAAANEASMKESGNFCCDLSKTLQSVPVLT